MARELVEQSLRVIKEVGIEVQRHAVVYDHFPFFRRFASAQMLSTLSRCDRRKSYFITLITRLHLQHLPSLSHTCRNENYDNSMEFWLSFFDLEEFEMTLRASRTRGPSAAAEFSVKPWFHVKIKLF